MTASFPDDGSPRPTELIPGGEAAQGRFLLARQWAYVVSATAYLPLTHTEIEQHMLHLVNRLFDAVRSQPFDPAPAAEVGARLVEMRCVGRDSIRHSIQVVGTALLSQPELHGLNRLTQRVITLLGEMMVGYVEALRGAPHRRGAGPQQSPRPNSADAQRPGLAGQAQFTELVGSFASGIAVLGLDGRFRQVTEAVPALLGRPASELIGLSLPAVVDQEDGSHIRDAFDDLFAGKTAHLTQHARTTRRDGSRTQVSFHAALVRDADGQPQQVVTVIEEDDEATLLRHRIAHQGLHDELTGLPNRLSFRAELEKALHRANPATGITVYHLDLDGFSLVTGGYGEQTGEKLLRHVAESLKSVLAPEKAVLARLGADEFGIVVENSPTTPAVPTVIERINEALSEPAYLDGENGLATSASVGVVHRPDPHTPAAELLHSAELTLRRAKSAGRGQWLLADPKLDAQDREAAALAAAMPGALETGEIRVIYRPVVRLATGLPAALEAVVCWEHGRYGRLPHDRCVALAEPTGLVHDLGAWLLSSACQRLRGEPEQLWLSIVLTRDQAADPDLVGRVRRILDRTGLPPHRLVLGFPSPALAGCGETVDNLTVLSEIGVRTILEGFGAFGDLLMVEELPVNGIRIDRRLVARQTVRLAADSPTMRLLRMTIELAHHAAMRVSVDGIDTEEQAEFWRAAGIDYALGDLFGSHA